MKITQSKAFTIDLIKVKAYNKDFFNNQADLLAKEALNLLVVEINHQKTDFILLPPC